MIRPLRVLHRGAFPVLALALPALVVAAVRGRHAPPAQELPDEYRPVVPRPWAVEDWLVYWVDAPARAGALPEGAQLVGTLYSRAHELTPPPGKEAIFYSLIEARAFVDPSGPGDRE
ncbi:MAG TPA: hypothetical protein VF530_20495 [Planctomycetota bacterium]